MSYHARRLVYDQMKTALLSMSQSETVYKQTVENANTFLTDFRLIIQDLCEELKGMEHPRMELIHSSINQFVVFERSAEMNNKYDVSRFSHLLETYKPEQEIERLEKFMYDGSDRFVPDVSSPGFRFVTYSGKIDLHRLTADQLREPKEKVYSYLEDLGEEDIKAVIQQVTNRIFCFNQSYQTKIHQNYGDVIEILCRGHRAEFVRALKLASDRQKGISVTVFTNLKVTIDIVLGRIMLANASNYEELRDLMNWMHFVKCERANDHSQDQQPTKDKVPPVSLKLAVRKH